MAVRYSAEHKAFYGTEYTVEIHDADFSGTVVEFIMEGEIGWGEHMMGEGRARMNEVIGTEVTFRMRMDTPDHESFITDILSSREGRFTTRIYNTLTSRLAFAGVVLSDSSGYPDASPYSFEIVVADGLASLKDVKYNDDGDPYVGVVSLVEHVLNCLNKLDYVSGHYATGEQFLAVSVDWYEATMASGADDDPMYQSGVDHAVFYKFDGNGQDYYSCYEVLTIIMRTFGARIYRQDKGFVIDQLTYRTGTMQVRRYDIAGTVLTTDVLGSVNTIDQTSTGALEATGMYGAFEPLSSVKVVFEAKERRNFVAGWEPGATFAPQSASISASGNNSILRYSGTLLTNVSNASLTEWDLNPLYLEFRMTLKIGGRWARRSYEMVNFQIHYSNITWETSAETLAYVVPFNFPTPGNYTSNQYNIDIVLPPLESSGAYEFNFEFFRVLSRSGLTVTLTNLPSPIPKADLSNLFSNAWLEVYTFGFGTQYADEVEYEALNNEATNLSALEIKTLLGDSDNPNTVGRLQVRDGAGWVDSTYWGDGTNDRDLRIGHLLAKLVLAGQTVPVRKLQASFFGSSLDIRRKYTWGGAEWVMLGGTREAQTGYIRGEFVELKYAPGSVSVSPVKLILHQSPSTSLPNSPPGGGNTSGNGLPPSGMQIPPATIMGPISDNYTLDLISAGTLTTIDVTEALVAGEYQIGDEVTLMNPLTGQGETVTVTALSGAGDLAISVSGTITGNYPDGSYLIRRDVRIPSGVQGQVLRKGAVKWEGYGDVSITDGYALVWTDAGGWAAAAILLSGGGITGVLAVANGGTGLSALGAALQYIRVNAAGTALEYATLTLPTGTVTSVALSMPSIFSVSGSPVTSSGTLAASLATQLANLVFAGPSSGGAATPTFRALVALDIPNLDTSKITTGALPVARGGTGLSALGTALQLIRVNAGATALEYFTLTLPTGTVTSVALSMPSIFSVSGSPVTTSGTLSASLATQLANLVFAGPSSGGAATPTFRALVALDIPNLDTSKLTTGTLPVARGGTGLSALGTALQYLRTNAGATAMEWATLAAITGSGVAGQVAFFTGSGAIGGGVSFLYDSTNFRLQVNGSGSVVTPTARMDIRMGIIVGVDEAHHYRGNVSDAVHHIVENIRNVSGTGNVIYIAQVGGTSAGDPTYQSIIIGGKTWTWGPDNSDLDKWKLKPQASLGAGATGGEGITVTADVTPRVGINTDTPQHPHDVNGFAQAMTFTNRTDATGGSVTFSTGAGSGPSLTSLVLPNGNMGTVRWTNGTTPTAGGRILNIAIPAVLRHANKIYVTFSANNDLTARDIAKFSIDYSATTPSSIALKSNALLTALDASGDYYLTFHISGHA